MKPYPSPPRRYTPPPPPLPLLFQRHTQHRILKALDQDIKCCVGRISINDAQTTIRLPTHIFPHIAEGSCGGRSRVRLVQHRRLRWVVHVHLTGIIELLRQRRVTVRRLVVIPIDPPGLLLARVKREGSCRVNTVGPSSSQGVGASEYARRWGQPVHSVWEGNQGTHIVRTQTFQWADRVMM